MFAVHSILLTLSNRDNWIYKVKDTANVNNIAFNSIVLDSVNNSMVTGYISRDTNSNKDIALYSISEYGETLLKKRLEGLGTIDVGNSIDIAIDQTNYVIGGQTNTDGTVTLGNGEMYVVSVNSSGVINWKTILGSVQYEDATDVRISSGFDTYVVGNRYSTGTKLLLASVGSTGTVNWRVQVDVAGSAPTTNSLAFDGTNIYVGYTNSSGVYLLKFDTSGNNVWQKQLAFTGINGPTGITVDASGNIYVCSTVSSTRYYGVIAKYSPGGILQWQYYINNTVGAENTTGLKLKFKNGYIYFVGLHSDGSVIVKFSTTGSVIWQRKIYSIKVTDIDVDANNYYLSGSCVDTIICGIIAKFPIDGSKLGSYGGFQYTTVTNSILSTTYTDNNPTLTVDTPLVTEDVGNLTAYSASTVDTRIEI